MTGPPIYDITGKRVWVAGEYGMVGAALTRRLRHENCRLLHVPRHAIDFRDQSATSIWIKSCRPQVIFIAAARDGGIASHASRPAAVLYDNLLIAANIIHAAHEAGVQRLLFLGSTSVYPSNATQPIAEEALLTGSLGPRSEWLAIAKIAGIKLTQAYRRQYGSDFIACQPTTLYGPGDNYDPETSRVLPALLRKIHYARRTHKQSVTVWGSGLPMREFLHVDDLADAALFLMRHYTGEVPINIGSREEISVAGLARLIAEVVGFKGEFEFDSSRPDGPHRRIVDSSRLRQLGWKGARKLKDGIAQTYEDFLADSGASGLLIPMQGTTFAAKAS